MFSFVGTLRIVTTFLCDTSTGHCGGFRLTTQNKSTRVEVVGEQRTIEQATSLSL